MHREGRLRGHRAEQPVRGDTEMFAALRGEWTRPVGR